MKTGYIVAGLAVIGGLIYLMMGSKKVVPGARTQGNVSNSGVSPGGAAGVLNAVGGLLSHIPNISFGGGSSTPPVGSPAYQYGTGANYGPGNSLDDAGYDYQPPDTTSVSSGGNYGPESSDNAFGTG